MRNGWNWKYPLSYMYPAHTRLLAKWSSPSIGDRRATGCSSLFTGGWKVWIQWVKTIVSTARSSSYSRLGLPLIQHHFHQPSYNLHDRVVPFQPLFLKLILYHIFRVLSIPSDPFQELHMLEQNKTESGQKTFTFTFTFTRKWKLKGNFYKNKG